MKLSFKKNLGSTDRALRAGGGLILITLTSNKILTGWIGKLATIFAITQIIDAAFSYCILYDFMSWSTRKKKLQEEKNPD